MQEMFVLKDRNLTIRMPEEIDHHQATYISEMADLYILKGQVDNISFDFSRTTFMDSSGIGIVVGRYRKLSCLGGRIYVIHANKRMTKMFYMSGLLSMVDLIEN